MNFLLHWKMEKKEEKGLVDKVDKKKIMEKAYAVLKGQGKNTVEGLLKYLKERKILDDSTEKIAKQALSAVSDPKNIDYTKFAEVCESVAKEKGFDMENISKNVAASLFGEGSSGGSSPAAIGDPTTSANVGAVEQYRDDDDHETENHASAGHGESCDDHSESSEYHREYSEDHHESSEDHHESSEDHHDSEHNKQ